MPTDPFANLKALAAQLPKGLRADWRGTDHYELTEGSRDYWWLDLQPNNMPLILDCESDSGKRYGLVMDVVAEVGRLNDEGVL